MENIRVTKRDGSKELINLDKIHQVLDWAVEGLDNVSISQIEMKSSIQFYDGITTDDIHETLVKTAADLISEATANYQYVASRLALFRLRKVVYGGANTSVTFILGYVIRLIVMLVMFTVLYVFDLGDLLFAILGMFSMKVAAYIQPFTDKLINKIKKGR